jgi:hypothetical protein
VALSIGLGTSRISLQSSFRSSGLGYASCLSRPFPFGLSIRSMLRFAECFYPDAVRHYKSDLSFDHILG